ncbi:MAG TPA: VCBS repeat-containing protein [Fibrobacteria bacterium]|nr:VCBS repeat-containing protein [Fibrobacteria bacterium]
MLAYSRAASKVISVALAVGSIASARTGIIDMNGDEYADIPLAKRASGWSCLPTMLGGPSSMAYSCIPLASGSQYSISEFLSWGNHLGTAFFPVRNSYPNTTSLAWAGGLNWQTIPVASVTNSSIKVENNNWDGNKSWNGTAKKIAGLFNGDQNTDILYVKLTDESATMAFGSSVARFTSAQLNLPAEMAADLRRSGAKWFVGDVTGDKLDDIVIVDSTVNMGYVGVAISQGGGNFSYRRSDAGQVQTNLGGTSVKNLCFFGDFDGDGKKDLAVMDSRDNSTMPIAYSNGEGGFTVVPSQVGAMNYYASLTGARSIVGDFNGDGVEDIALAGGAGWRSIPVAFGAGNRAFTVTNNAISGMTDLFGDVYGTLVVGDFNKDGKSDIAVVAATGSSIFVASSLGGGNFSHSAYNVPEFQTYAHGYGVFPVIEVR